MSSLVIAATVLQLMVSPTVPAGELPLTDIASALREIWSPLVEVIVSGPGAMARVGAQLVELRVSDAPPVTATGEATGALAWVDFIDGQPQPVITVSPRRADEIIRNAVVLGRPSREWPATLSRRVRAHALARAIAHEIGHYLMRSREHSPKGLMRPTFTVQDLVEPGVERFRLTASDRTRLLTQLSAPLRASTH